MKRHDGKHELAKHVQRENFDQLLLDAIDEALSSLGEEAKASIYSHLKDTFKIGKQEIPLRLSDFSNALERIFGFGAGPLEILFMKNLHAKIRVTCKWPKYGRPLSKWIGQEMTFQEYVHLIRTSFETAEDNKVNMGVLVNENEELQK